MATHMDLKATWSIPFLFTCGRLVPFFRGTHTHALNIPEIPGCSALAANCRQDTIPFSYLRRWINTHRMPQGNPNLKFFWARPSTTAEFQKKTDNYFHFDLIQIPFFSLFPSDHLRDFDMKTTTGADSLETLVRIPE